VLLRLAYLGVGGVVLVIVKSPASSGKARGTDGEEKFHCGRCDRDLIHWYAGRSLSEVADHVRVRHAVLVAVPHTAGRQGRHHAVVAFDADPAAVTGTGVRVDPVAW
jgi:hypothetical protein